MNISILKIIFNIFDNFFQGTGMGQ